MREMKKTIFFDRDGTLIIDKIYLNDPNQIEYLPGVFEALRRLRDAEYQFVVVTNQSGVPRGLVTIENLNEIHRRMTDEFARHGVFFAGFYYAAFSVESNHPMRKPNPGMLMAAAQDHKVDLSASWMIGDRISDVEAGHRAGCRSILLEGVESRETAAAARPAYYAPGILEASQFILSTDRKRGSTRAVSR
jgi:D-glycero-D-manno-heptose 1,7-bisphosphate phosphatase